MLININWLKEIAPFSQTSEQIANHLTNAGSEAHIISSDGIVIELEVTPNRSDLLSHVGVARELGCITRQSALIKQNSKLEPKYPAISDRIQIDVENPDLCPIYCGGLIEGVSVKPSPDWLQERLISIGLRPINNIVDITNYVLMEIGQPLHAFDYNRVYGHHIIVKMNIGGEEIVTLDNIARKLPPEILLICDEKKTIALAGIIGGLESSVTDRTTSVIIESAFFDPVTIRKGAKKLAISTEASKRFERHVDHDNVIHAFEKCIQMILDTAGGKCAAKLVREKPHFFPYRKVVLPKRKINSTLGVNIPENTVIEVFQGLGIETNESKSSYSCTIPSYRPDLERSIDLIEEVARIYGYDNIPSRIHFTGHYSPGDKDNLKPLEKMKSLISQLGFSEIFSNSLTSVDVQKFFSDDPIIEVKNPISSEMAGIRSSIFPGLLQSISFNQKRGSISLALFECGNVFRILQNKMIMEELMLSGVICGDKRPKTWKENSTHADSFAVKGIIETTLTFSGLFGVVHEEDINKPYFVNGRKYLLNETGEEIAEYGQFRDEILQQFDLKGDIFGYQFNCSQFIDSLRKQTFYEELPTHPGMFRDLCFVINQNEKAEGILNIIRRVGGELVKKVDLNDVFVSPTTEESSKNITFRIYLHHQEHTLTDTEVSTILEKIIYSVTNELNAKLR